MASFLLDNSSDAADHAELRAAIAQAISDGGAEVTVRPVSENTAKQKRMLFGTIDSIRTQTTWYGKVLDKHAWKNMFSACITRQEVVPALDGHGFVVIGGETKNLSRRAFADLITVALAFGNERNVKWKNENWESMIREYIDTGR